MKGNVITDLISVGIVVSFFVGLAFLLSRQYSRWLDNEKVPYNWLFGGGIKQQWFKGMQASADGRWKPVVKKLWLTFLIADLVAVIIVSIA